MIWSQALGLDSATCAGLVHGQWLLLLYSLRINVPEKDWQLFFLELSEILKRQWPTLRVFNACPSDWSATSFKVKFLFEKYAHACLDIASWTFDNNSYSFCLVPYKKHFFYKQIKNSTHTFILFQISTRRGKMSTMAVRFDKNHKTWIFAGQLGK